MRRVLILAVLLALLLTAFAAPAAAQDYGASSSIVHVVERGETLSMIARYYGVSMYDIASANHILNLNRIYAGMRLHIPGGHVPPPHPPVCHPTTYVVRYGDTLGRIAAHLGSSVSLIASANNIYNINHIYAGMVLHIPCGGHVPPHHPPQQPPYHPPQQPDCFTEYTVQPRDTLTRIARIYQTTVQHVLDINPGLDPNYIRRGQVINVPLDAYGCRAY